MKPSAPDCWPMSDDRWTMIDREKPCARCPKVAKLMRGVSSLAYICRHCHHTEFVPNPLRVQIAPEAR